MEEIGLKPNQEQRNQKIYISMKVGKEFVGFLGEKSS